MSVILIGAGFLYGVNPDKPKLPEGWKYIEQPAHWLVAEAPNRKQYFVSKTSLTRLRYSSVWDVIRTLPNYFRGYRPFRLGSIYADPREQLNIESLWL